MEPILAEVHNTQHDKRMTLPSQPVLPITHESFYVLYMCLLIPSLSIKVLGKILYNCEKISTSTVEAQSHKNTKIYVETLSL